MKLKANVKVRNLSTQILLAINIADTVYQRFGVELVITSITDSHHSLTSLHYRGDAADLRTSNVPDAVLPQLFAELKNAIPTTDYDIILEKDHIHIEWQPKGEA